METYVLAAAIVLAAFVLVRGLSRRTGAPNLDDHAKALERLTTLLEERDLRDREVAEAYREVQRVLAGSFSKGRVGENLLASALQALPPSMVVRDFRIGGRTCEFALRMADGKLLPVDSKWSAVDLSHALADTSDPDEQARLRKEAEKAVGARIKEIAQYLDPALTLPMAVAAVPDSVYHALERAHAAAHSQGVVIVSYSTALPYLLSVWHLHRAYAREVDTSDMLAHLGDLARTLQSLEGEVEGRLSRGVTMVDNAAGEMRSLLGSARTALRAIERTEVTSPSEEEEASRLRAL
jgi:DNA recombination protein RmuC